ncbi:hypothetical protein HDU86_001144 [Geranomyces michiganensis]|nr:hypothetical protein HDU86_001144 [Geranomyces michiganensis]
MKRAPDNISHKEDVSGGPGPKRSRRVFDAVEIPRKRPPSTKDPPAVATGDSAQKVSRRPSTNPRPLETTSPNTAPVSLVEPTTTSATALAQKPASRPKAASATQKDVSPNILDEDLDGDHQATLDPSQNAPLRHIEAVAEKYNSGKGFDIVQFMNNAIVTSMTFADLMYHSPHLRRKVTQSLRTIKKPTRISLLQQHPFLGLVLDEGKVPAHIDNVPKSFAINKISVSHTSTHVLQAKVNGAIAKLHIDGGCCLICVSSRVRVRHGWDLSATSTPYYMRLANGTAPSVEGEVHDLVVTLAPGMTVPVSVVSLHHLDMDFLFGRPFLKITRALADHHRHIYHLRWGSLWAVGHGAMGAIYPQRSLTPAEREDWDSSRPPKWNGKPSTRFSGPVYQTEDEELSASKGEDDQQDQVEDDSPVSTRTRAQKVFRLLLAPHFECEEDANFNLEKELLSGTTSIHDCYHFTSMPDVPLELLDPGDRSTTPDPSVCVSSGAIRSLVWEFSERPDSSTPYLKHKKVALTRFEDPAVVRNDQIIKASVSTNEFTELSVMSWNTNSVRNVLRGGSVFVAQHGGNKDDALHVFLERHRVDILCIQEHRLTDVDTVKPAFVNLPGYTSYYSFSKTTAKGYSGTAIIAQTGLTHTVVEGFHVAHEVELEGRWEDRH